MPYSQGTRLPGESASKLGHLTVIQSEWVKALVSEFEHSTKVEADPGKTIWNEFDPTGLEPFRHVWAVDGSFVTIQSQDSPPKEVSFIKTALLTIDRSKLDEIDKDHPHPLHLRDILTGSGIFHATVLPLKNIRTQKGNNFDTIRNIVFESMKIDQDGAFFETLKWLAYQKWSPTPVHSPAFSCPHCKVEIEQGLPVDANEGKCSNCSNTVFLTDMIGFHLDMGEESAPDSVASAYMLIMEHLMIFTPIRLLWHHQDKKILADSLLIKDGPLTLRGQYSKLVEPIREFLQYAKDQGRPVHIIGQEKSGRFFDHLASIARFAPPDSHGKKANFAVLSHDYVRQEVYRVPDLAYPYGQRTNWGEKVYWKPDPGTYMVLNVPTGRYNKEEQFPQPKDLIGLNRVLATLSNLISHKFEGALFPIELANGIASMSSYPSAKILERFINENSPK